MEKPEQANPEREMFIAALDLPSSRERLGYLKGACGGDAVLFERMGALLDAHEQAGGFLVQPPTEVAQVGVAAPLPSEPVHLGSRGTKRSELTTEKPGDKINHYRLLQQIGKGGCGVVYMAEQEEPVRRRVALKIIKIGMDTQNVVARFEAERQALALMDHPNIAKVLDAGATESGRPYFVMELVRGIPITSYCNENKLPTAQRLDLFTKVCLAIQHAHQKGIIHRDIKPSNILVTLHDGVPVPKVIDFGIAKATEARLTNLTLFTEYHAFIGTPAYTSPEQAEMSGLDIDTRADIYSLGVLLYELLTGRLPFNPEKLMKKGLDEMRRTIREVEPPPPSTCLSTLTSADLSTIARQRGIEAAQLSKLIRGDLDWIVMKALEKDRTRRYESAITFAQDIQRHLNNEAVLAFPPSAAYQFQKLVRRHKLAFAAVGAVVTTLICGIAISGWQANEARQARDGEKQQRIQADTERGKALADRDRARSAEKNAKEEQQRADSEADLAIRLLYLANINMAKRAWEKESVGRVLEILDLLRPQPGRPDLRGFEWFYLNSLCHSDLLTLKGHTGEIWSVAFSPNGKLLASASADQTVKVWDALSGQEILTLKGHGGDVYSVAFSPDGKRLASASADQTVRVWDATTGREALALKGHTRTVRGVTFSPDGKRLASASYDRTVKVWDAKSGEVSLTLNGHTGGVESVAFSADGKRLASASDDQTVKVWDATSGQEVLTLKGHSHWVTSVAFSPETNRLASASHDGAVKVWNRPSELDGVTRTEKTTVLTGYTDKANSVVFSANGKRMAAAGYSERVIVWDTTNDDATLNLVLRGHTSTVTSVAFSPDGQRLASASFDETVKVWDATSGQEMIRSLIGHKGEATSIAFSGDGKRLASASDDRTVRVWDVTSGQETLTLRGHTSEVLGVAFSTDGKRLASASDDHMVKVWDATSGELLLTLNGHTRGVTSVAFSADGKRIASASRDQTVKVWNATNGTEALTLKGHTERVTSVAFSVDGKRIASASDDRTVKVWDAASGKEILTLKGHVGRVKSVALSVDGKRLASASDDQTVKMWDATSGKEIFTLNGHSGGVTSVAFSADGKRLASTGHDGVLKVWCATSGQEMLSLDGQTGYFTSVAFGTNGKRLASASSDGSVRVWDATPRSQDDAQ